MGVISGAVSISGVAEFMIHPHVAILIGMLGVIQSVGSYVYVSVSHYVQLCSISNPANILTTSASSLSLLNISAFRISSTLSVHSAFQASFLRFSI